MKTYRYTALTVEGRDVSGTIEAEGERGALRRLVRRGVHPLTVEPTAAVFAAERKPTHGAAWWPGRLSQSEVTDATRELCAFLQAGIPLDRGLSFLSEHAGNPELGALMADLAKRVRGGASLTEALEAHPREFDGLYRAMASAGETSGQLTEMLDRLAGIRERARAFRGRIVSALTYPAIMTVVMFGSVAVMMVFVVPRFTAMFSDMGTTLPLATRILAGISDFLATRWWMLAAGAAALALGWRQIRLSEEGRRRSDAWLLRLPLAGPAALRTSLSRFCLSLGTLLQSGIPLERALVCVRDVMGNAILVAATDNTVEAIRRGVSLGDAMQDTRVFPDDLVEIVRVGEQSGRLDVLLAQAGDRMEEKVRSMIEGMLNAVEPLMILVMGVVIGFVVMAMMLPIFGMDMNAG